MTRVPGDDTDAGTRTPGDAPSRWWLNPALAQLAFGSSVDMAGSSIRHCVMWPSWLEI